MNPAEASAALRRIAATVESATRPSKQGVVAELRRVISAIQPPKSRKRSTSPEDLANARGWLEIFVRDSGIESTDEHDQVEQAAWETGYEGTPLPSMLKMLGEHFQVDVVHQWEDGRTARSV